VLDAQTSRIESTTGTSGAERAGGPAGFATEGLPAPDADAMVARLRAAKRPLILVGPAEMNRSGRQRAAALAQAGDVPVVGMQSPRGVNDPALGALAEVLAQADCVLLLGKKLDFSLRFGSAPTFGAGCEFLQIDADDAEMGRSRQALGLRLVYARRADTGDAMAVLLDAFGRGTPGRSSWRSDVADAPRLSSR
jgi:acetolactate synthase-1/2/3 large subunit